MPEQIAVFIDFENLAIWAEQEFRDFELSPLLEYLQSRGPVVVKRAYADWARFSRYRDELMDNSVDLTQIYSVRAGKNRADIRIAIDALEVAMMRQHISTFVIVSGDSDFGPLAAKLREYGRYTIGVGPGRITHPLLVKSCDEFVYLETILSESFGEIAADAPREDRAAARELLTKALRAFERRGEIPVLAAKLKPAILSINPAFNEANLGYPQFRTWLEDNSDLVKLYLQGLDLFVAPADFIVPADFVVGAADTTAAAQPLAAQYQQLFRRLKMSVADLTTRRDVLRDVFRALVDQPHGYTTETLLEELQRRYLSQGMARSKTLLRAIWQMGFRQRAFEYEGSAASMHTPLRLAPGLDSEAALIARAESSFIVAVVQEGLPVDVAEIATLLLNDANQGDYVRELIADLLRRGQILQQGDRFRLPSRAVLSFDNQPALQVLLSDIQSVDIPAEAPHGPEGAHALADEALQLRSRDFMAAAQRSLIACRLQYDALKAGVPGASQSDLCYYMASYASVQAGALAQVQHQYAAARPYYLAFFALMREEDLQLWERMRGLINPMLSYYWANAGRDLGMNVVASPREYKPHEIAAKAALHQDPDLVERWRVLTQDLAEVNPHLLRRVVEQLRRGQADAPEYVQVAEQIEAMLA
ncbi:MAG TPA: NYN domain-containing protein [Roseiflexaceae bacterium]|nr:NYN domain-containing protein [Roseiflexaceae bacterium]